jgi:hypothetical protein
VRTAASSIGNAGPAAVPSGLVDVGAGARALNRQRNGGSDVAVMPASVARVWRPGIGPVAHAGCGELQSGIERFR